VLKRGLPAILLLVPLAGLAASTGIVQAAEECRLEPGVTAPPGGKWLYRIDRDHHRCWFLGTSAGQRPQPHRSVTARNRHVPRDTDAGQQPQQRKADIQIASVQTSQSDIPLTVHPLAAPHAAPYSVEQSSDNLIARSVPTIAYKVQPASVQTALEPTAAPAVQPTAASASNSAMVVLVAATAGLLFAAAVFSFSRRDFRRSRQRRVAGVEMPLVVRSSVAANPSMTTDWAEDLRRKVRELNRPRRDAGNLPLIHQKDAIALPDASTWLIRPKEKPIVHQLIDA
jgi:hypothetical protein